MIPSPSSPAVAPLMGSLQAVPPDAIAVRVGIIQALGETRDPAILRTLLLVATSRGREVRQAVAVSLGRLRHSLSAYLLLPMLKDGSSRVRNAAMQALMNTGQFFCAEAVLLAAVENNKLRVSATEALRRLSLTDRHEWMAEFERIDCSQNPALSQWRTDLLAFCQTLPEQAAPTASPMDESGQLSLGSMIGGPVHVAGPAASGVSSAGSQINPSQSAMTNKLSLEMDAIMKSDMEQTGERAIADLLKPTGTTDHSIEQLFKSHGTPSDSIADFNFFESVSSNLQDSSASHPVFSAASQSSGSHSSGSLFPHSHGSSVSDVRAIGPGWPSPSASGAYPGATPVRSDSNAYVPAGGQMAPAFGGPSAYPAPYPGYPPYQQMPYPAAQYAPMGGPATPPVALTPPTSQPFVSMDMTASSPLIPAFSSASGVAVASGSMVIRLDSEKKNGQIPASDSTVTPAPIVQEPVSNPEAEAAERVREQNERNLARLREAREVAFRKLLETREELPKAPPRLLTRKIAGLLATPATDIEAVRKRLLELGDTGSPTAIETISSFGNKPSKEVRAACAKALGMIPHAEAAAPLLRFLGDKSGTVVEIAVASLISIKQPDVRGVILAAGLVNNSLRTVVMSAVEELENEEKSSWEQFLLNACNSSDVDVVAFSVSLLSRFTGAAHREFFEKFVSHESAVMRAAAVEALVRTGEKRIIGHINDALEDSDARVRSQAALALATIHSPKSVSLLSKLFSDADLTVRRSAAQAASRMDEPELGGSVAKALESESDPNTVEHLLAALNRNGGESASAVLIRYVEGDSGAFRELALKALRKLKIPSSAPLFVRMLDDNNPSVRRQSVEQLAVLKQEKQLPRLREMLKRDPDETVRAACAKAIGDFQDKGSLGVLEEAVEDHPVVKLQAVIALGRLGQSAAGPTLLAVLKDSSPEVRYQAVRGIGQLKLNGCEEAVEALMEDPDKMVRRGAEQTLIDLGVNPSALKGRQIRRSFARIVAYITPKTIAGAIPGGVRTLMAVALVLMAGAGYFAFTLLNSSLSSSNPDLRIGWIQSIDLNSSSKTVVLLRKYGVLELWSVTEQKLLQRIGVGEEYVRIMVDKNDNIALVGTSEIKLLKAKDQYSTDSTTIFKVDGEPQAIIRNSETGAYGVVQAAQGSTTISFLNPETLSADRTVTLNAELKGAISMSADMNLAISVSAEGDLILADLKTSQVVRSKTDQMVPSKFGRVFGVAFTNDLQHVLFLTSGGCIVANAGSLRQEAVIDVPAGVAAICPTSDKSSFTIVSRGGSVLSISDKFEVAKETGFSRSFDLISVGAGGELVAVANTEEYEFDVFSVSEQKVLMTSLTE